MNGEAPEPLNTPAEDEVLKEIRTFHEDEEIPVSEWALDRETELARLEKENLCLGHSLVCRCHHHSRVHRTNGSAEIRCLTGGCRLRF